MSLNYIASKVLNAPLLLEPGYARVFFSVILGRMGMDVAQLNDIDGATLDLEQMQSEAASFGERESRSRSYRVENGVAVLPITGSLVNKLTSVQPYSGMTGYNGIITRMTQAMDDPEVKGVLLDMDTPGGEVAGCFDTAQKLRTIASESGKPLWALANDMYCSAGMALASAADHRLITQSGIVGSVGVLMAHTNYEKYLKDTGIDVTLIYSGQHKVEGNPYAALPKEVLERFENSTHELRQEFAALVAGFTGMSVDAVLATEAATYRGQAAIDVGFANELINSHEAVQHFSNYLSSQGRAISLSMESSMIKPNAGAETDLTKAPQAGAETEQADPTATTQETPEPSAAQAERARVGGILNHANAQGRTGLANHLAFETELSVDAAAAMLAKAEQGPGAGALADSTALDTLMDGEVKPKVGADSGDAEPCDSDKLLNSYTAATGRKAKA